jgi:hypothetical protein
VTWQWLWILAFIVDGYAAFAANVRHARHFVPRNIAESKRRFPPRPPSPRRTYAGTVSRLSLG